MRSSDIATRCREIALRVECSGEWGELGDTLREAAAEVERLRLRPEEERLLMGVASSTTTPYLVRDMICTLLRRQGGGE